MNWKAREEDTRYFDKSSQSFIMIHITLIDDQGKSPGVNQPLHNGASGLVSAFHSKYLIKSILRGIRFCFSSAMLYLVTSVPFYLHCSNLKRALVIIDVSSEF